MTPASVQLQTRESGERVITLVGDWTLASLRSSVARVWKTLKSVAADPRLTWDLRRIGALDSTGALLIWRAWGERRRADALKTYGAELYIINLLGMSIIRELGPLLVAILLAGRSGAAMTAQIGVMRVTEEIDAMATLGISPTLRLVLPKAIGLALAMPLVSIWSTAAALAGGAAAANLQLGISPQFFFESFPNPVPAPTTTFPPPNPLTLAPAI